MEGVNRSEKRFSQSSSKATVNNLPHTPSLSQGDKKKMNAVDVTTRLEERKRVPQEIESLFRDHHEAVLQAAYRVTGDRMAAEDVLQTLFVKLLRRDLSIDIKTSAVQYLRRAAVNLALDQLRKRKRQVPLDAVGELSADRGSDPTSTLLSGELANRLRSALAQLHPTAAEMFALRHFEGLSNTEIARLVGTSWGTVAVTLHRAHRRLRKDLSSFVGGRS
jgi:RNA polymerase sigma-70 factor (ECF subfamily)